MRFTTLWKESLPAMNEKVLSLLGLARRAGRLTMGFDPVTDSVKTGQSRLVLITSDISPKNEKELRFSLRNSEVQLQSIPFGVESVGSAIGKAAKIISVNDDGFASSVMKLLGNNGEE